jgi:hypothetical protein
MNSKIFHITVFYFIVTTSFAAKNKHPRLPR